MKEIPLRNRRLVTLVDDDIYELFGHLTWGAYGGPRDRTLYARHKMLWCGRYLTFSLHREILGAAPGVEVDHINGDGLDNRRANLRLSSRQGNNCNKPAYKNNKSGYKGVSLCRRDGGWRAQIQVDGRVRNLGTFKTPEDAHVAYCAASIRLHGDFSRVDDSGWVR